MQFKEIPPSQAPMDLLLIADPSEAAIKKYLNQSRCFIACTDDSITGVCMVKPIADSAWEIMNIAVAPTIQQKGLGTQLLIHVIEQAKASGAPRIEVGTGTFGYQLIFYQRQGFRVDHIDRDFFLKNYPEPVMENGIQHKDMLKLTLQF